MTLPSTSRQPLPANSTAYLPSSRNKRPRQNRTGASKCKRGGQPGNQNARKLGTFSTFRPGSFSPILALKQDLKVRLNDPASPLDQIVEQARIAEQELFPSLLKMKNAMDIVPASLLFCKLTKVINRAYSYRIPFKRLSDALTAIAHDPFGWFERGYKDSHISRDADSFFPVSEKSAQNSPLPPNHPILATNLTDSQWAVLAPLIPPDPHLDWLTGEPPTIIAANRWGFTQYYGWFNDMLVMENYYKIPQRCPALCAEEQALPSLAQHPVGANPHLSPYGEALGRGRGRGRPRTSPRALLDAILWKLATGQNWEALPLGFPPMRLCRKYYRRLFLSGRLYTLLLALYNHMRLESSTDLPALLEAGVFTTTPAQKIALSPHAPPTWENYTALLFMQLARSAYTRLHRQHKQANPISLPLLPVFQGTAALSTGIIPSLKSPEPELTFQPLEDSLAWKKWRKIDRDQKTIAREVSKRLRAVKGQGISSPLSRAASRRDKSDPVPEREGFGDREAARSLPVRVSRSVAEGGPEEGFQPLELNPAWKKWRKIEQDQKIIADEVSKYLHSPPPQP